MKKALKHFIQAFTVLQLSISIKDSMCKRKK